MDEGRRTVELRRCPIDWLRNWAAHDGAEKRTPHCMAATKKYTHPTRVEGGELVEDEDHDGVVRSGTIRAN